MISDISDLLHPRIVEHCIQLVKDNHFKNAAREAIIQVELALKEKSGIKLCYGINLIKKLFGKRSGIKLILYSSLGADLQEVAELYFKGAFKYYRNYLAHDGSKVTEELCLRILILASELLHMIGASSISYSEIGGVSGLLKYKIFPDKVTIVKLLNFLDGQIFYDEVFDGFFEELAYNGFTEEQLQSLFDLGLIKWVNEGMDKFPGDESGSLVEVCSFKLTNIGLELMNKL